MEVSYDEQNSQSGDEQYSQQNESRERAINRQLFASIACADTVEIRGHRVSVRTIIVQKDDGTLHEPIHRQQRVEVYQLHGTKGVKVPGINVIVSDKPSCVRVNPPIVQLFNFIVNEDGTKTEMDTFYYQQLIVDALLKMYHKDLRIVTTPHGFDIGTTNMIGRKATDWMLARFKLGKGVDNVAVLRRGTW